MTSRLRAGVIGAGVFGGHHAAKWASLPGVALAAVLDPHPERAQALAGRHGARAVADAAVLFDAVDIVSIASPAYTHGAWALKALAAGRPVYVEKPLAIDLADADAIAETAARRGLVVGCGFLERAAFAALGLFDVPEAPLSLEAVRLGVASPRNLDVSVVLDLMIHDLDLALALGRGEPLAVEGEGACVANDKADWARAEVTFDDGFVGAFHASRVAVMPERSMSVVYPSGTLKIDFLTGGFTNTTPFALDPDFAATSAGRDRLGASLHAFLRAVRGESARPMADAADGVRALDLALAVQQALAG
ncbi:MAG TPA: Gfo/Idh/MocA family oxidoreductase [Caulobacteraceae bacterium]|nr:Gfo/Idh/MocA family oxidoreductase [Caulobacteraceae bacterium]